MEKNQSNTPLSRPISSPSDSIAPPTASKSRSPPSKSPRKSNSHVHKKRSHKSSTKRHKTPYYPPQPLALSAREEADKAYDEHVGERRILLEQPECAICFEKWHLSEVFNQLSRLRVPRGCASEKCKGRICTECWRKWKREGKKCPFCRGELEKPHECGSTWGKAVTVLLEEVGMAV